MAYLIFEIPILYRRLTRRIYVPVYFAFFPFGYSEELYAKYFDEDYYWQVGGPFNVDEMPNARIKIIWLSLLSLMLSVFLSPFITALFCAYTLSTEQFRQFMWTLAAIKALLLGASLYNLRYRYVVTDLVPLPFIAFLYATYLATLLLITQKSSVWINAKLASDGFFGLLLGVFDFLIFDVGIYVVLVSLVGWLVPWRLTQFKRQDGANQEEP